MFDGDSLTFGEDASTPSKNYPSQTIAFLGGLEFENKGLSAQKVGEIVTRGPTAVDYLWPFYSGRTKVYCLWAGTNDISNNLETGLATYTYFKTRCQDVLAAGANYVIALTCLPRASGNPGFETQRQLFNGYLRNLPNEVSGVVLVDIAADSRIGDAGDNMDATYYNSNDHTHLNDTGYAIVATAVASAISAIS